jgi:hypothetical protein
MGLTEEWKHVVLAHGIKFNVTDQDHFLAFFMKHRFVDECLKIGLIPRRQKPHCLRDSFGGPQQTLALRVLADELEFILDETS